MMIPMRMGWFMILPIAVEARSNSIVPRGDAALDTAPHIRGRGCMNRALRPALGRGS
jgi:hypothetical protein